jgi:hypothetical protein
MAILNTTAANSSIPTNAPHPRPPIRLATHVLTNVVPPHAAAPAANSHCGSWLMFEDRRQKAEDRRQKTEDRRQKTEGRRQKTEDTRQKAEDTRQKAEDRRQKTEGRRQKAEDRRQKAEDGRQKAEDRTRNTEDGSEEGESGSSRVSPIARRQTSQKMLLTRLGDRCIVSMRRSKKRGSRLHR